MQHRKYIVINRKSAITIIMIFILSGIQQSQSKADNQKETIRNLNETIIACPGDNDIECSYLKFPCLRCNYNYSCQYGKNINVTCAVLQESIKCKGERTFLREMNCRYCYQTEPWQHTCAANSIRTNCNTVNAYYKTNCTVYPDVFCLGNRSFTRNVKCNWTQGYRWSTALIISLTLGGFGADRFYLGHWQEGIGKLFSFGGLGVWTIIDVLLISLHYLGPADGSLYI